MKHAARTWSLFLVSMGLLALVAFLALTDRPESVELLPQVLPVDAAPQDIAPLPVDALAELYAAARREGFVHIWGSTREDLAWIPAAFADAFPGVSVSVHVTSDLIGRVNSISDENDDMDVVWTAETHGKLLSTQRLLADRDWLEIGRHYWGASATGDMAITNSAVFAIAYRADLVAKTDVPISWQELAADKYRGRLAANQGSFVRLCAALGAIEGSLKWLEFVREFGENSQTAWTENLESMLQEGGRPYAIAVRNQLADTWRASNAQIEVVIPEPVVVTQFGSMVLRNSPHPNAARLLALWLSSSEGKMAREQATHAVDLSRDSLHPRALNLRNSGKIVHYDTGSAMDTSLQSKMQLVLALSARGQARRNGD